MARLQGNSNFLATILKNIGELGSVPGAAAKRVPATANAQAGYDPTQAALPIQQSVSGGAESLPPDIQQSLQSASDAAALSSGGASRGITADGGDAVPTTDANGQPLSQPKIDALKRQKAADQLKQQFYDNTLSQIDDPAVADGFKYQFETAADSGDPALIMRAMQNAQSYVTRKGKTPHPTFDITQLPPDIQEYAKIPGVTPEDVSAMVRERYTRGVIGDKSGGYHVDRTGLPDWTKRLTDADLSSLVKQEQVNNAQGGADSYWPRLKGQSIQIVNNDEFKRSGLRTGDTVCIKIP